MPHEREPFALLAQVRRALRVWNAAIEDGCRHAGLTVQQQAFLLALAAHQKEQVLHADVRVELQMDQATASELAARLVRRRLVSRSPAADPRAWSLRLTPSGRAKLLRSIEATRHEIQHADQRGELAALRESIAAYLDYYTARSGRGRARSAGRASGRRRRRPASKRTGRERRS